MAKLVGITGGIGSGKSKVMQYIASLGYPIYFSDEAGKRVMQQAEVIQKVQSIFTENVIVDGSLDRKKIGSIVFNDTEKLKQLNAIVHPAVANDFKDFVASNKEADFIFYESAILIESNNYKGFDFIVLITAPIEVRIQRVMERDHITREQVLERMKNQMSDDEKKSLIDFEIINVNFDETSKKIDDLIRFIKK